MKAVHIMGAISALLYIGLGWYNEQEELSIGLFLGIMLLLTGMSFYLSHRIFLFHSNPSSSIETHCSITHFLFWAIIFRWIGLMFSPIFEDDHFRFLWDGFLFYELGSPYGIAPSDYFGKTLSLDDSEDTLFQSILGQINHPDIPTIYGPVLEFIFLFNHYLFPGDVFGLQLISVIFDIGILLLLKELCPRYGWVLYAWSPLVIKEFAFTAHPDVIAVFFMIASIYALKKHALQTSLCLISIACCAKVFALLVLPFIMIRCPWRYWWWVPIVILCFYGPFIWTQGVDFQGLSSFSQTWQFNASIYAWLQPILGSHIAKILGLGAFVIFALTYWFKDLMRPKPLPAIPRGDWIFGVFFLISPVLNAWYFVWILVFAAMTPSRWAWAASFCLLLSYITGVTTDTLNLALYQQPWWALSLEYGLIALALLWDWRSPLVQTRVIP